MVCSLWLGSDSEEYLPSSYCISSSSWIDALFDEGIDHGLTGGVRKSVPCPEDEFVDVVHRPSLFYQEKVLDKVPGRLTGLIHIYRTSFLRRNVYLSYVLGKSH